MSRLLFVEGTPSRWEAAPGDKIIALTAEAAGWLDRQGVRYACPSDFGAEESLDRRADSHWREQVDWLQEIDQRLWKVFPSLRSRALRPARLYGYFLKTWVDNLFIRGEECLSVLSEGSVKEVILWPEPGPAAGGQDFFSHCLQQRSVIPRLLSYFCALRGIPYRVGPVRQTAGLRMEEGLKNGARAVRSGASALFRRVQTTGACAAQGKGDLTLLFLERQYDLKDLLADSLRAGHRCLVRQGTSFLAAADGRFLYTAPPAPRPDPVWERAAQELLNHSDPLWEWPDRLLGHPLSPLLKEIFAGWVRRVLPEMIFWSDSLCDLYRREGVDFVLAPALAKNFQVAAVAACRAPSRTQSVLIAHGDGADVEPAWDLFDLFPYQHYFVPDQEFTGYFRERRELYPPPVAQVHAGTMRWKSCAGLANREGKSCPTPEVRRREKPVIVYACGQPEHDPRYLNTFDYPEVDYFRLQKALVQTFASALDFTFVVKLFPGDRGDRTALGRLVRGLKAPNLFLSEAPFRDWLPWADRVILETPSTPMYEAALAGVPFHLLAPASVSFRPEAVRPFSACITLFRDPEEAARQALERLRPAPPPLPSIQPEETSILETLARLRDPAWDTQTALSL